MFRKKPETIISKTPQPTTESEKKPVSVQEAKQTHADQYIKRLMDPTREQFALEPMGYSFDNIELAIKRLKKGEVSSPYQLKDIEDTFRQELQKIGESRTTRTIRKVKTALKGK